jgi:hypothetical protein
MQVVRTYDVTIPPQVEEYCSVNGGVLDFIEAAVNSLEIGPIFLVGTNVNSFLWKTFDQLEVQDLIILKVYPEEWHVEDLGWNIP